MSIPSNSRREAVFIIARWLASREFPDRLMPQGGDRAFVQDLVYTTIRRFRSLHEVLSKLVERMPKGEGEALLLVGAAQILFMPDVPDFAAVNETVDAAKLTNKRAAGLVNAVLRNLIRRRDEMKAFLAAAPLATRESYPTDLVARWEARYGKDGAETLAKWHNEPADTYLAYPPPRGFEKLPHGQKVVDVPGFNEGAFIVQDPATAAAVELLEIHPGLSVLDACAAPGGKTVQIAWRLLACGSWPVAGSSSPAIGNPSATTSHTPPATSQLLACDVKKDRLVRVVENLKRCRLDWVKTGERAPKGQLFDRVLVDAPCSNTGVLRRRPDARWRWDAKRLEILVKTQAAILADAATHVAPGGRLVYSTCSNEPEENGDQVKAFLAAHPDFHEAARRESLPTVTGYDGAFACALDRAKI